MAGQTGRQHSRNKTLAGKPYQPDCCRATSMHDSQENMTWNDPSLGTVHMQVMQFFGAGDLAAWNPLDDVIMVSRAPARRLVESWYLARSSVPSGCVSVQACFVVCIASGGCRRRVTLVPGCLHARLCSGAGQPSGREQLQRLGTGRRKHSR